MKFKSIIASGLLLLSVGAATTSCKDMFTADNNLVATDLAPKDTVYQMMGIIKRMQPLMDRTVLLGEVRADLVEVTSKATTDIQELGANNVSLNNAYNKPSDYYNVINACNVYLANVDAERRRAGDIGNQATYFRSEIVAAKCFRAWCYLELAKIYGEVPFILEPVLSSKDAEDIVSAFNASGSKANMGTITATLINDLKEYADLPYNCDLRPSYSEKGEDSFQKYFIPVRVMLGELYLWKGSYTGNISDYENAIVMYHDFLTWRGEERLAGDAAAMWGFSNMWSAEANCSDVGYNLNFEPKTMGNGQTICYIPTDTLVFDGNISELRSVFCSNYKNDYYPLVVPSQHLKDISKAQKYAYFYTTGSLRTDVVETNPSDPNLLFDPLAQGDLRLYASYKRTSGGNNKYDANLNAERQFITKYLGGDSEITTDKRLDRLTLYRTNLIYLHLAEALNAAGFPETAFVVLKYGLSSQTVANPGTRLIPEHEYSRLGQLKSRGMTTNDLVIPEPENQNSFLVWNADVFQKFDKHANKQQGTITVGKYQSGIHGLGSGDCDMYDNYYLPTDSSKYLDELKPLPTPVANPGQEPAKPCDYLLEIADYYSVKNPGKKWEDQRPGVQKAFETIYNTYVTAHNDSVNTYQTWVVKKEAYDAYIVERDQVIRDNRNVFSIHEDVVVKRQRVLDLMILEEEALEGMFEGQRFYDVMRWAMRNGQAKTANSIIAMPDYNNLPAESGETNILHRDFKPADNKMHGKPWYLPLPTR